jgi:hypothetical protein
MLGVGNLAARAAFRRRRHKIRRRLPRMHGAPAFAIAPHITLLPARSDPNEGLSEQYRRQCQDHELALSSQASSITTLSNLARQGPKTQHVVTVV